jgi:hypothetical protein
MNEEQPILSNFDRCKTSSKYHFDNSRADQPGEWFNVLGQFKDYFWQEDLEQVKTTLRPMSWATLKTTLGRDGSSPLLDAQELDIKRGGGDPKMTLIDINDQLADYAGFQKMIDFFGLEQAKPRFHAQHTGQVFNYHIDTFYTAWPDVPHDRLIRIGIMLEDWQPGQFYIYGNRVYDRWKAGEAHWFKWQDVPHGTANASSHPRYTLQVTGIRTELTDKILSSTMYQDFAV